MDELTFQSLKLRADAGWRTVVRHAAYRFDLQLRSNPAFRSARKRFYRKVLARHGENRRDIANAYRH
jgi:hypothetical protein